VSDWLPQSISGNTASVFFRPEDRAIAAAEIECRMELLDPFTIDFTPLSTLSHDITVLCQDRFSRAHFNCPSGDVLLQRLDDMTMGVISNIAPIPGVFAAGGAVAYAIAGCRGTFTDIDLFLRCDPSEAMGKLKAIYEACRISANLLSQGLSHKNMLVTRTSCTVTMFISNNQKVPPVQVVLQVVDSVSELLGRFDVDCAAVAFEPATGNAFMSPRAKRAFETGCNVLDSRFNSHSYASRLWKYTGRGFGIAVPGLDPDYISRKIVEDNYVYFEDKDVLLRIDRMGRFGPNQMTVVFDGRRARMAYLRCDEVTKLDGMLKLVVMDQCSPNGNIRTVSSPRVKECEKCKIQTAEPAVSTDSPLLLHAGLPRKYNLLWGAELAADDSDDQSGHSDTDCHSEVTEDMAGYACTPLTRAYDLFDNLLEMQLLEEDVATESKFGIVSRLSAKMQQQNGEVAAAMCRRHCARVMYTKGKGAGFAWELINANTDGFDSLKVIFDAGVVFLVDTTTTLPDDIFERNYGLPRSLRFKRAEIRCPTAIDWYRDVY
jgi:hypothetical protein